MMIKLCYEVDDAHIPYTAIKTIDINVDSGATLDEMLEAYEQFLRAVGYTFNGTLDIIKDDEYGDV